jgi:hypothetical protein
MNENEILRMVRALEDLREGQKLQLERQQEALALIVYVSWLIFR